MQIIFTGCFLDELLPTRATFPRNFQCRKAPGWLSKFYHFKNWEKQLKKKTPWRKYILCKLCTTLHSEIAMFPSHAHLLMEASELGTLCTSWTHSVPSWSENHLPNKDNALQIDQLCECLLSQRYLREFRNWPQKSNEERLPSWPPEGEHINSGGAELSSRPPSHVNLTQKRLKLSKKALINQLLFLFVAQLKKKHKKSF